MKKNMWRPTLGAASARNDIDNRRIEDCTNWNMNVCTAILWIWWRWIRRTIQKTTSNFRCWNGKRVPLAAAAQCPSKGEGKGAQLFPLLLCALSFPLCMSPTPSLSIRQRERVAAFLPLVFSLQTPMKQQFSRFKRAETATRSRNALLHTTQQPLICL